MVRLIALSASLAIGMAGSASAAGVRLPLAAPDAAIVTVGEGCGPGMWRSGPDGRCRPFNSPYGSYRGTTIECPPGWHIGPGRGACWPNR